MRCDLMHKDIPVAELDIDEADGSIGEIIHVMDVDRLPLGSIVEGDVRRDRLRAWWFGRSIPVTRSGVAHLMRALDLDSTGTLLSRSWTGCSPWTTSSPTGTVTSTTSGYYATRTLWNGWGRLQYMTAGPASASIWSRRTSWTMPESTVSLS